MLTVYFDRNAFADICELRNGLTNRDVLKIKSAVVSGSVIIPASATIFVETIRVLKESPTEYHKQIRTVLSLVDKHRMVKHPEVLLRDDCYRFAEGMTETSRTVRTPRGQRAALSLSKNRAGLIDLASDTDHFFDRVASRMTEALLKAREAGLQRNVGRPKNFRELWDSLSTKAVEGLVSRCSQEVNEKCRDRGLDEMLKVKSIRFYTLYYLSLIQSGWFGIQDKPRKVRPGDFGDWFHAVQASVADIFVTQEAKTKAGRLPYILNQLPTPDFVVMSVQEFLGTI